MTYAEIKSAMARAGRSIDEGRYADASVSIEHAIRHGMTDTNYRNLLSLVQQSRMARWRSSKSRPTS